MVSTWLHLCDRGIVHSRAGHPGSELYALRYRFGFNSPAAYYCCKRGWHGHVDTTFIRDSTPLWACRNILEYAQNHYNRGHPVG